MVKLFILFFITLPLQAANLSLTLSSDTVEKGKSITATFEYQGNQEPINIDLTLWENYFFIQQSEADTTLYNDGNIITTSKARLYPRKTGNITLDAIAQGGSFVKPRSIRITPSIRNNIDATPIIHNIQTHYWADEAIFITIDVPLHYKKNEVIAKDWEAKGINIAQLPSIKTDQNVQLKWLIYTPVKGQYELELPAIVQRGKGRFRFHSPKLKFTIKPLPAYLPSSIASGTIEVTSNINTLKDNTQRAEITLKKDGYLPKDIDGIQTFLNELSDDELSLQLQVKQEEKQGKTIRTLTFNLPNWLILKTLELNMRYFDTEKEQLETINHQFENKVTTIPKNARQILAVLFIIILFFLLIVLIRQLRKWNIKRAFKNEIKQAKYPNDLRLLLVEKYDVKTLEQWTDNIGHKNTDKITQELNSLCYSKSNQAVSSAFKRKVLSVI